MADYRLGALLGVATGVLLCVQEPMSSLAAQRLSGTAFILVTQVSLALSIPLLNVFPHAAARISSRS